MASTTSPPLSSKKIDIYRFNYRLLNFIAKKDDYFDKEFTNRINIFKKFFKQYIQKGSLVNPNIDKQQNRILDNYIIPLSYLIYGYIYTKYNDMQKEKRNIINNNLAFNMFDYFFNHNNPAVLRANAYYYLRFKAEKEQIDSNNNNIYLFNYFKEQKNTLNLFIKNFIIDTYINKYLSITEEYDKYNNINTEYNKIKTYFVQLLTYLKKIYTLKEQNKIELLKNKNILKHMI